MKLALTNGALKRPWLVILAVCIATGAFVWQFPKVRFDNDPENMLAADEAVRVFHHEVKERYALYDFVIVGIVNTTHPDGIFNTGTLGRIAELTDALLSLRRGETGWPEVRGADGTDRAIDLTFDSAWERALAVAFRHDPNRLFQEDGRSAILKRELIAPGVVDNIRQAELGSLKLEYLMESPPVTREEALRIRADAMANPLYRGTLVSEDGKAICVYIPITEKTFSYNVASLVHQLTADWDEEIHITGLPVAEDTFGVEMLVQMASSAPLAGLAIFLLMLLFFRRVSLIIAPMIVALVSVLCTMGLLIGLGFDVHIMSSMIAIFLMPIAVADSVHILSEFFDVYHRFGDKAKTVRHVIGHLFTPMLYTSLTTIAGFASLGATPIPPVRIFGLHVAFGVGLAWLLTMTLIPAYIMVAVPQRTLDRFAELGEKRDGGGGILSRSLERLGIFGYDRRRWILGVTLVVVAVSIYGISRIRVNDNPVKWFTANHPIRRADTVLNEHFGGTYTAYLTLAAWRPEAPGCDEKAAAIAEAARARFGKAMPEATERFLSVLQGLAVKYRNVETANIKKCFVELVNACEAIDEGATSAWTLLADEVNYLEVEGLTHDRLVAAIKGFDTVPDPVRAALVARLDAHRDLTGEPLLLAALAVCDEYTALSFKAFVYEMEAELTAPLFKRPAMLRWVEGLQQHLHGMAVVGKTSSAVDALKKATYELSYREPPANLTDEERTAMEAHNAAQFTVPDTASTVGQVFLQLEGMKKKDSLFHLITKDYQQVNLWVQLKSGDNRDMETVVSGVEQYIVANPPPVALKAGWAGLTYLNVVWQDKMVRGMLGSLASSFVVVLAMMMILFRSPLFGILAMIPLTVTIMFIYGLIGLVGKDYDMPVAVLSALTLGLSVDFAIHFLERARELQRQHGEWRAASREMFKEPAMAISRNAITISVGFTPLLLAPLVPYRTVGFFLATIMAVSWVATLFILSAAVAVLRKRLFRTESD